MTVHNVCKSNIMCWLNLPSTFNTNLLQDWTHDLGHPGQSNNQLSCGVDNNGASIPIYTNLIPRCTMQVVEVRIHYLLQESETMSATLEHFKASLCSFIHYTIVKFTFIVSQLYLQNCRKMQSRHMVLFWCIHDNLHLPFACSMFPLSLVPSLVPIFLSLSSALDTASGSYTPNYCHS